MKKDLCHIMKPTYKCMMTIALAFVFCMNFSGKACGQTTVLSEGFEGGSIPTGWTTERSSPQWQIVEEGIADDYEPYSAYSGDYCLGIYYSSSSCSYNAIYTPAVNLSGYQSATLSFYLYKSDWSSDSDELKVYYRASSSASWTELVYLLLNRT